MSSTTQQLEEARDELLEMLQQQIANYQAALEIAERQQEISDKIIAELEGKSEIQSAYIAKLENANKVYLKNIEARDDLIRRLSEA